jgi:hypothetical protein
VLGAAPDMPSRVPGRHTSGTQRRQSRLRLPIYELLPARQLHWPWPTPHEAPTGAIPPPAAWSLTFLHPLPAALPATAEIGPAPWPLLAYKRKGPAMGAFPLLPPAPGARCTRLFEPLLYHFWRRRLVSGMRSPGGAVPTARYVRNILLCYLRVNAWCLYLLSSPFEHLGRAVDGSRPHGPPTYLRRRQRPRGSRPG